MGRQVLLPLLPDFDECQIQILKPTTNVFMPVTARVCKYVNHGRLQPVYTGAKCAQHYQMFHNIHCIIQRLCYTLNTSLWVKIALQCKEHTNS